MNQEDKIRKELQDAMKDIAMLLSKFMAMKKWDGYECKHSYILTNGACRISIEDQAYVIDGDGKLQEVNMETNEQVIPDTHEKRSIVPESTERKMDKPAAKYGKTPEEQVADILKKLRLKG